MSTFDEILAQVVELLQREGRVSYRALKRRFNLDDEYVEDLKDELIEAKQWAADEGGKVLVWIGASPVPSSRFQVSGSPLPAPSTQHPDAGPQMLDARRADGERRQLTVMFCDLVGSTALSAQLDPEELREVVRAYQETCTTVIRRYDGHVAQHLGDGLLVYFGYPQAHEDDAQRAVRAGLEIIQALQKWVPSPLAGEGQGEGEKVSTVAALTPHPNPFDYAQDRLPPQGGKELRRLHVRIGIHTGLVVIGEIGSSEKREILALGETPNIAARVQGQAAPDEVVISAVSYRLVEGLFECEDRGQPELKGVSTPLTLYRVVKEGEAQSRFQVVVRKGLTPLVGRDHEHGLLHERWERVKDGNGQVVLLSGEPGIGKSRLVEALKETVEHEGASYLELRGSPYSQNSALYPVIEHLQRVLGFQGGDSPEEKLRKLVQVLGRRVAAQRLPEQSSNYVIASAAKQSLQETEIASSPATPRNDTARLVGGQGQDSHRVLQEVVPLFAALLSLPHPDGYPPLALSPQKQKEKTHEAIVVWLCEEAKQQAVTYAWEDLHWADPSTLDVLTLFLAQVPTTRLLAVLTFRPEFTPPWGTRSYLSQLTLSRLGRTQVELMVETVTGGKALPVQVVQQIASKTDGVPLFVEELTKMVVESDLDAGATGRSPLPPLGIPATLHDALMARLDRLGTAKEVAQLGATLGREFNYDVLQAVSPLDEGTLQNGLKQLVEAELVYQSGVLPQARYHFKHALVQDAAYQSLLKSRRQQLHQQVAQVLTEQFAETVATQPQLVAQHYTAAGLMAQALPYWQQAGQRASQRGANAEAVSHLTTGLELLQTLPDTPARTQQELSLQLALGGLLTATKGVAAPEVEHAYGRARELCEQTGDREQVYAALFGLTNYYAMRLEHQTACALADQLLSLAQEAQDLDLLIAAHRMQGNTRLWIGEFLASRFHLEQGIALYDSQPHRAHTFRYGHDLGVACRLLAHQVLWILGYPDQALKRAQEALALAQGLSHITTLGYGLACLPHIHFVRGEWQAAQARAEACVAFATEVGLPYFAAQMSMFWGAALAAQGHHEEGITKMRHGLAAQRTTGGQGLQQLWLALQVEAYIEMGQIEEGWTALEEALTIRPNHGERYWEPELYRLKGQLTLQQFQVSSSEFQVINTQPLTPSTQAEAEAEACFQQAIETARELSAKSFELRAATSLARLWQQQGRRAEARQLLAEIYNWFTEGFDTKDLQEAAALLQELA